MIGYAPKPFEGYKLYVVYHKKEQRRYACLVDCDNSKERFTITYAKYLMSVKLGRRLDACEQVDHIDDNKLNDAIENLQILSLGDNVRKSHPGPVLVTLVCSYCEKVFTRNKWKHKKGVNVCCGNMCAGKLLKEEYG